MLDVKVTRDSDQGPKTSKERSFPKAMTIPVLVEPDDIRWGHSFKKGQTCTKRSQLERPGAFESEQYKRLLCRLLDSAR